MWDRKHIVDQFASRRVVNGLSVVLRSYVYKRFGGNLSKNTSYRWVSKTLMGVLLWSSSPAWLRLGTKLFFHALTNHFHHE